MKARELFTRLTNSFVILAGGPFGSSSGSKHLLSLVTLEQGIIVREVVVDRWGVIASKFHTLPERIMSRYRLSCPACEAIQVVGVAQAGSNIRCSGCGQMVEVPGTRELRLLPLEVSGGAAAKSGQAGGGTEESSHFLRLGMAFLLLLSFVTLTYGGYLVYLRWMAPIEFGHTEEEFYQELYETALADPVARSWDHWNFLIDAGIPEDPEPPPYFVYNRFYEAQKPWMIGFLVTGGVSLLMFLLLGIFHARKTAR